jgi:hypothetical protein
MKLPLLWLFARQVTYKIGLHFRPTAATYWRLFPSHIYSRYEIRLFRMSRWGETLKLDNGAARRHPSYCL